MVAYLVSYDLTGNRNYDAIEAALRKHGKTTRVLLSTWLLESSSGPGQVVNSLLKTDHDKDDRWMVIEVTPNWSKGKSLHPKADEAFVELLLGSPEITPAQ